ncbi:MAG: ABC transporter permease subunit [Planctomycetaceae bacterium]|nr:ABC transporter permease subunit [Planctomycetaceae bacterium]
MSSGSSRLRLGLPLLAKELLEQSARKRTYVLRTVYAFLLFAGGLMMFYEVIRYGMTNPLSVLGRGRDVFQMLIGLQVAGIYLFMPAITCTVITSEKERKTLGLLLLTKLGPWTIVLEKYLGRCFTMLTFLMLSLPMMAFAYSMGGVNAGDILIKSWILMLTTLQVGAFALMCSCLFRTTTGAFIGTYLLGFLFYFGPAIVYEWSGMDRNWSTVELLRESLNTLFEPLVGSDVFQHQDQLVLLWIPTVMLFETSSSTATLPLVFVQSLPSQLSIVIFLCLARVWLVKRAFVPPRNAVLSWFRKLDGLFVRLNQNRLTKGRVLFNEATTLPEDQPIAWRETRKKSLGTVRYLIRVFLVLEAPVLTICLSIVILGAGTSSQAIPDELSLLFFLMWMLSVLLVVVKASSLIAGERTHETLDVLLTTPLTTEELISQKLRGLWRLLFVVAVPLLTIILFETWLRGIVTRLWGHRLSAGLYFLSSVLAVLIYLPLAAWISLYFGMRMQTQARALFASLATIVGWCLGPVLMFIPLAVIFTVGRNDELLFLILAGPATIIPFTEFSALREIADAPWVVVVLNFVFFGMAALVIRAKCLRDASRLLGRAEPR